MSNAKLGRRLDESCLRFSNGRKGLIEIGRHLTEISAFRLRRQPQRDTDLMDIRLCLDNFSLRDRKCGLPLIVLLPAYGRLRQQLLSASKFNLCQLERGVAFIERGNAGMQ